MKTFHTKIELVDTLLGWSEGASENNPFMAGDILVIRGGPGSGKTTLGLQIISRFLEESKGGEKAGDADGRDAQVAGRSAVFVSLESDPKDIVKRVRSDFDFFKSPNCDDRLTLVTAAGVQCLFGRRTIKTAAGSILQLLRNLGDASFGLNQTTAGETIGARLGFAALGLMKDLGLDLHRVWKSNRALAKARKNARRARRESNGFGKNEIGGLIFIDSLNAFLMYARQGLGGTARQDDQRRVVNDLCVALRKHFKNFLIICSSEFHNLATWQASGMSESFVCDAEIALESEPIAVPVDYIPNKPGSAGYSIFKTLDRSANRENSRLETRSFIRVTKHRHGANQSRRCSYDIIGGKGLSFYETYPGDGHILLFNENAPQRDGWNKFFSEDAPHLYPTLRYETFDRSSLANTFSIQRHFNYIPKQTDLYLSSFDNFWISWYGELNWKWAILKLLDAELRVCSRPNRIEKNLPKAVNSIHRAMNKQTEIKDAVTASIKDKLELNLLEEEDRRKGDAIRSILTSKTSLLCLQCVTGWALLLKYLLEPPNPKNEKERRDFIRRCLLCELTDLEHRHEEKGPREAYKRPSTRVYFERGEYEKAEETCNQLDELLSIGGKKSFIICRKAEITERMAGFADTFGKQKKTRLDRRFRSAVNKILDINKTGPCALECDWKKAILEYLKDKVPDMSAVIQLIGDISRQLNDVFGDGLYQEDAIGYIMENLEKPDILKALTILARVYSGIITRYQTFVLLREIPQERIKLFGERDSRIIRELEVSRSDDNRPIFRPDTLFSIKKRNKYISIPYDANIGLFVARMDILDELRSIVDQFRKEYAERIKAICLFETTAFQMAFLSATPAAPGLSYPAVDRNVEMVLAYSGGNPFIINTWEEMIALLDLSNKINSGRKRYHFLLETQSPSSFYSAFLEILWNCGGDLVVGSSYSVPKERETKETLFRALVIFGIMFQYKVIPFDATYDLDYFTAKYNPPPGGKAAQEDWVFARHWYSTLIDILSAKEPCGQAQTGAAGPPAEFYWKNDRAKLELMEFPVSVDYFLSCKGRPRRFCCWGDWHLGISSGSENVALGIDLINNLMSSQRICERAEAGAGLPTVEDFYDLYGSNRCVKALGRPDKMIPSMTYRQLRSTYYVNAKSRSQIFDYQHCIQEIDSLFKFVYSNSTEFNIENPAISLEFFRQLKLEIDITIMRIKNFKNKPMQFNVL